MLLFELLFKVNDHKVMYTAIRRRAIERVKLFFRNKFLCSYAKPLVIRTGDIHSINVFSSEIFIEMSGK